MSSPSPLLQFEPVPPLSGDVAEYGCRASVIVPARNEQARLPACLDALASQVNLDGSRLPAHCYEVLVLLNDCTDASAAVVRDAQARHSHSACMCSNANFPHRRRMPVPRVGG